MRHLPNTYVLNFLIVNAGECIKYVTSAFQSKTGSIIDPRDYFWIDDR